MTKGRWSLGLLDILSGECELIGHWSLRALASCNLVDKIEGQVTLPGCLNYSVSSEGAVGRAGNKICPVQEKSQGGVLSSVQRL